ncbi:sigma-70 family RNA polymerase sigma factor [Actinotalea sp. K2]|uniref:sigma-70 family RNA polymerase sigma factor n=1 Tax=Actinotalea sp. K2 TaxID=2939438 RepID=UPI0027E06188|nr:sigma-70 family RNA polymerase sigma factor [Actinotalea sp. K2]
MTSVSSDWELSSDAELITAVRGGESAAFGALYERHASAARAVARQYTNSAADAEDAVSDAFSRVFVALRDGGGPDVAFRAYLFTVVRRVGLARVESARRTQPTDDLGTFEAAFGAGESTEEPAIAGFERGVVSEAYKSLPERWQAVLWYTEVEQLSPAEIAPVLGLTANGVAALAYRAREGLRQAYLQQHLAAPIEDECREVNAKLGSYVRGGLAKRETAQVDAHLGDCGECRALVLELSDVNHGMRVVIAPLVLGGVAVAAVQGIGFGGAAGVLGAAAATGGAATGVGASGSMTSGTGTGVGGAGAGGAGAGGAGAGGGSLVGAGAAGSAASTGLVGAGAGALVAAGAVQGAFPAGAAGAPTGAAGAPGSAVGASTGAGVGAGAGGAGAAASAGGLAGLVGALPVGAIGIAVAGVVVAASIATAGLLGVFSPGGDADPLSSPMAEEEPAPGTGPGGDGSSSDDAPSDGDAVDDTGGTSPTDIPGDGLTDPAAPTGEATPQDPSAPGSDEVPGGTSDPSPTDPGTSDPSPTDPGAPEEPTDPGAPEEPVDPPPPAPAPARVEVLTEPQIGEIVAGQPQLISLEVANTGEQDATGIRTELEFPAGTTWTVEALGSPAVAGGMIGGRLAAAVAVPSAWTCAASTPTVAACSLDVLPPGARSTLRVNVTIIDDSLDGPAAEPLELRLRTWIPGGGAPAPDPRIHRVAFSSAPAVVRVQDAALVTLVGDVREAVSRRISIPVTNAGGTSVPVDAVVRLPTLPEEVSVRSAGPWFCEEPSGADLTCRLATLPKAVAGVPTTVPLELDLVVDPGLRNADLTAELSVVVPAAGTAPVGAPFTVRSAPGVATVAADPVETVRPGAPQNTRVRIGNLGGTDVDPVGVEVLVPAAMGWRSSPGSTWTPCGSVGAARLICLESSAPVDGETVVPLTLLAPPGQVAGRSVTVTVTLRDLTSGAALAIAELGVDVAPDPASITATSLPVGDLIGDAPATVTVETTNSGGTSGEVRVAVSVPAGAEATDPAGQGWGACAVGQDGLVLCEQVVTVGPGATEQVDLTLRSVVVDGAMDGVVRVLVEHDAGSIAEQHQVRLASAPAVVGAEDAAAVVVVGDTRRPVTGTVSVPVSNTGGTSVPVEAFVRIPSLPAGVSVDPVGAWACAESPGGLDCRLGALSPAVGGSPTTVPLELDVRAGTGLRNVDLAVVFEVEVSAADDTVTATAPVTVRSAPGALTVSADLDGTVRPGAPQNASVRIGNAGGTDVERVRVEVVVPAGIGWVGSVGAVWTPCGAAGDSQRICLESSAPVDSGTVVPLTLLAPPGQTAGENVTVMVTVRDLDSVAAPATAELRVRVAPDPASITATTLPVTDLVGDAPATMTVETTNSGGTSADVRVAVTVPAGAEATDPAGQGWGGCVLGEDGAALCEQVVTVGPGVTVELGLTLRSVVVDGSLDGAVRVVVEHDGQAVLDEQHEVRLSSAPADVSWSSTSFTELVGGSPDQVVTAITNTGGTTAEVLVSVSVPEGAAPLDPAAEGWSGCTSDVLGLCQQAVTVGPGATAQVALTLRSTVEQDESTGVVRVVAQHPSAPPRAEDHPVRLVATPVVEPARLTLDLAAVTTLERGEPRIVSLTVQNTGQVTARGLAASVSLPAAVQQDSLLTLSDWACGTGSGANTTIPCTLAELAPGQTSTLEVAVRATGGGASGRDITVAITGEGTAPVTASTRVQLVQPVLGFADTVTEDLVLGSSGPVAFAVQNTGTADARDVRASVRLPSGVVFDALAEIPEDGEGEEWSCALDSPRAATCDLSRLPRGEVAPLVLFATAQAAVAGPVVVEVWDGAGASAGVITSSVQVQVASSGLSPRFRATGGYAVTEIGAPLLGCDLMTSACRSVMSNPVGTATNNGQTMTTLRTATGDPRDSVSTLAIPAGSTVEFAGLYWSANRHAADAWSGPLTSIELRAPGQDFVTVGGAQLLVEQVDSGSRSYYQAFADVTDLVRSGGTGDWAARGAAIAATANDPVRSYYAGWSLVVVYATPGSSSNVTVYDGGSWVATNASTTFAFAAGGSRDARIGVVAWEGDRNGTSGQDRLSLNDSPLVPVRWNGTPGLANDAFDSTANGSEFANTLGVDAKGFSPRPVLDGINRLTASTASDQYLIGAVTVMTTPR